VGLLKAIGNAVQTLAEEAALSFTPEALNLRVMDPSHVALVDISIPNTAFLDYKVDAPLQIALRLQDLLDVLKTMKDEDTVSLSFESDAPLTLSYADGQKREYEINTLDISVTEAPRIPQVSFEARATFTAPSFSELLRAVEPISSHLVCAATADSITFHGKGDRGTVKITFDRGSKDLLFLEARNSRAVYRWDYLNKIVKAVGKATEDITLNFATNKPLKLEIPLGEAGARLHFYLAPLALEE
jgi:proliferating cell nuclear antigen